MLAALFVQKLSQRPVCAQHAVAQSRCLLHGRNTHPIPGCLRTLTTPPASNIDKESSNDTDSCSAEEDISPAEKISTSRLHTIPRKRASVSIRWQPPSSSSDLAQVQRRRSALPPSRTIFIQNIPFEANNEDLTGVLEAIGARGIINSRIKTLRSGRSIGYGWVMFATLSDAIHAFELVRAHGLRFRLRGRPLKAQYADNDAFPMDNMSPTNRLFLGRFCGTPDDFYAIFDKYKDSIYWSTLRQYEKAPVASSATDTRHSYYGLLAFTTVEGASKCLEDLNDKEVLPDIWIHMGYAEQKHANKLRKRQHAKKLPRGLRDDDGRMQEASEEAARGEGLSEALRQLDENDKQLVQRWMRT